MLWNSRPTSSFPLADTLALLARTPATLRAVLTSLPDRWLHAREAPGQWSPYEVLGHLLHAEQTDWLPRVEHILFHADRLPLPPFDRDAHLSLYPSTPLLDLLDQFAAARAHSLARLEALSLTPADLDTPGLHPALGPVTLAQLLSTWAVHDLTHLNQIHRTIARAQSTAVGPWSAYLSILR